MPGYHTKKDGSKAKKGLYYNMKKKKKAGTSNSKAKSTVSAKSYKSMLSGFKSQFFIFSIAVYAQCM